MLRTYMHSVWHVLLLLTFFFATVHGNETVPAPTAEAVQSVKQNPFIAISNIPEQANTTLIKLQEIGKLLTEEEKVLEVHALLPSYMDSLQVMLDDPVYQHLDTQELKSIEDLRQKWVIYLKQLEEWQQFVKTRLQIYDENRVTLTELTSLWSETHINANKQQAPETIQEHITSVLIQIETLNSTTKSNYDMLLTDSQLISEKLLQINLKMDGLKEARDSQLSNIFVVDSAPFLALIQTTPINFSNYIALGISSFQTFYQNVSIYLTTNISGLYTLSGYLFFIILIIGYLYFLNYKGTLFTQKSSDHDTQFSFIRRPISTVMLITIYISLFIFTERSIDFKEFQVMLILLPTALLLSQIIHKRFMPYIYTFFLFNVIHYFEAGVSDYGVLDRLSALVVIAATFTLVCLSLRQKKYIEHADMSALFRHSSKISFFLCALLTIAFIANLYGTVALSDRITTLVFGLLSAILIFYIFVHVFSGLLIIFIRRRIAHAPQTIQAQAQKLERNVVGLMILSMTVWLLLIIVNIFGAKAMLLEWWASILEHSWQLGALTFSVAGIFHFFIILVITWLTARLVRIFLALEVFTRFKFPRGVPTAISTMSNHTVFVIGFIIALSTLGVSMQEFALIGGALGVGIGFGIRNIVANFISGIIMLFERPVQIGDTIEINKTMGNVQSIGSRATAIKTFDGSEVLIPNADFISADVTNWTLSDNRRRATLLIKVDFDSDIEKVLEIMNNVAKEHTHVLDDPAPMATFQGFGDYYLEFKLYYWLSDQIIPTKSDVAIGVFKTLIANGIKIPTPTRNIAIHNEES